jgi:diguanylate cyclase (GGDEF)-like protein
MDRIEFSRVARILAPYVALWLVVAAGLVAFQVHEADRNRQAALERGRAEAQNLSMVMSQHMAQVLEATDRTLTLAKLFHERKVANLSFRELADAMKPMQGTEAERRINLFDRDGNFVGSTDPDLNGLASVSIADRRFFAAARTGSDLPLYVGEPVLGRVSKSLIIPVAKRLESPGGAFDGVVSMALDPQRLVTLFRALRVGEQSSVGIAHRDGPVLAWARAGLSDADATAPRSIGEVVQAEHVVTLAEVKGTELLAFASLSEDEFLAEHRRFALATLAFTVTTLAAITLPIGWVGARAWGEVHRRRLLELRYASAYQQARTDALTGLANRTGFDEARREAHARLKDEGVSFALAFIDIDHFKRLNDSLGHDVGDEALRRVGETLTGGVRQSDAVGRLGGDEFAVLMPGVTGATMHRRFDPIKLDLDAMAARHGWSIGFSIGVVAYETPTPRERDAVNLADRMMYDAKGAGRDGIRYAVYRDGLLIPEQPEAAAAVV